MFQHAHAKSRGVFDATVLSNTLICREHYRMRLTIADFPPTQPGQFIQVQCSTPGQISPIAVDWPNDSTPHLTQAELLDRQTLLRRPFSLAGRTDHGDACELQIIYRTVGTGSAFLAGVEAGATVSVLGPLGNTFTLHRRRYAALVGGGVGIPPMLYVARTLAGSDDTTAVAFLGTRSADLLPVSLTGRAHVSVAGDPTACVQEFADCGIDAAMATDDGSVGYPGLVSETFGRWLTALRISPADLSVYACGPEPMLRAIGEICISRAIDCQLALERRMACGMGTCQACVVKVRDEIAPAGFVYKLCCTDGPVFQAADLIW